MNVGDTVFYLEHLSFYKVKIIAINTKSQALVEENDGYWLVVDLEYLYTKETIIQKG